MKIRNIAIVMTLAAFGAGSAMAEALDSDSATVTLEIGKYAQVTNLDDFALSLEDGMIDGAADSFYSGSDQYNLEANSGVNVQLSSFGNLSNGSDEVDTNYDIDIGGNGSASPDAITNTFSTFNTAADSVHNQAHVIGARAKLGEISSQTAGSYSADIVMTVSAL